MNTKHQEPRKPQKPRIPIYGSMWIALFLGLRQELLQPRTASKSD